MHIVSHDMFTNTNTIVIFLQDIIMCTSLQIKDAVVEHYIHFQVVRHDFIIKDQNNYDNHHVYLMDE